MLYAQFFHRGTDGSIIEACGDRAVIIIDARLKPETVGAIAADECKKRGFIAWQIWRGDTFTRSAPVSGVWYPSTGRADNTASSAFFGA